MQVLCRVQADWKHVSRFFLAALPYFLFVSTCYTSNQSQQNQQNSSLTHVLMREREREREREQQTWQLTFPCQRVCTRPCVYALVMENVGRDRWPDYCLIFVPATCAYAHRLQFSSTLYFVLELCFNLSKLGSNLSFWNHSIEIHMSWTHDDS